MRDGRHGQVQAVPVAGLMTVKYSHVGLRAGMRLDAAWFRQTAFAREMARLDDVDARTVVVAAAHSLRTCSEHHGASRIAGSRFRRDEGPSVWRCSSLRMAAAISGSVCSSVLSRRHHDHRFSAAVIWSCDADGVRLQSGVQPQREDLVGEAEGDDTAAHREDVGVVVPRDNRAV